MTSRTQPYPVVAFSIRWLAAGLAILVAVPWLASLPVRQRLATLLQILLLYLTWTRG